MKPQDKMISNFLQTGNHTIAIIRTKEEYESVRESLQNVISEVNRMSDRGFRMLGDTKITLEFFLGGDYKVHTYITILSKSKTTITFVHMEARFYHRH